MHLAKAGNTLFDYLKTQKINAYHLYLGDRESFCLRSPFQVIAFVVVCKEAVALEPVLKLRTPTDRNGLLNSAICDGESCSRFMSLDDDLTKTLRLPVIPTATANYGSVGRAFCIPIIKSSITLIGHFIYWVTIQVVTNLLLTSKQKLCFSMRPRY